MKRIYWLTDEKKRHQMQVDCAWMVSPAPATLSSAFLLLASFSSKLVPHRGPRNLRLTSHQVQKPRQEAMFFPQQQRQDFRALPGSLEQLWPRSWHMVMNLAVGTSPLLEFGGCVSTQPRGPRVGKGSSEKTKQGTDTRSQINGSQEDKNDRVHCVPCDCKRKEENRPFALSHLLTSLNSLFQETDRNTSKLYSKLGFLSSLGSNTTPNMLTQSGHGKLLTFPVLNSKALNS